MMYMNVAFLKLSGAGGEHVIKKTQKTVQLKLCDHVDACGKKHIFTFMPLLRKY